MVISKLIEVLESIGYPVYLQGSFTEGQEYPDAFFTYWRFDAPEPSHYNNQAFSCSWGFWIYVYSNNPRALEQVEQETKKKLKENGFTPVGNWVDSKSDEPTHTGSMLTVRYLETTYKEE